MNDYPPAVTTGPDLESGSEVMRLIGTRGKRRMFALDHWIGVDEHTAIGFATVEGVEVAVGLVHYAPITSASVRDMQVRKMIRPEPWMPRFDGRQPPSPDELRNRWLLASKKAKTTVKVSVRPAPPPAGLVRKPGQDPDEFYAEVARYYRAFDQTTGKPTSSIAQISGVTRNQAAQWVHQARRRGHLEPAEKGE